MAVIGDSDVVDGSTQQRELPPAKVINHYPVNHTHIGAPPVYKGKAVGHSLPRDFHGWRMLAGQACHTCKYLVYLGCLAG